MRFRSALAIVTFGLAGMGWAQGKAAVDAGKPAPPPAAAKPATPAAPAAATGAAAKPGAPATAPKAGAAKYSRIVKYPTDYRHWTHIKTAVIQQGNPLYEQFGGMHHVYANDAALNAWRENRALPNGAVFVFDLLDTKTEDNMTSEGPRKVLAVMERDTAAFASTGGWGFEAFKGDTRDRLVTDAQACFSCHQKQAAASEFVFSTWRP